MNILSRLPLPLLEKIEVVRHGKVRRSKLYYIRRLSTKEARLKERRENIAAAEKPVVEETPVAVKPTDTANESGNIFK